MQLQAPTKKQLEQRIITEKLNNNKQIFYSQTKKQRSVMGSVYPKDIILIFSPQDNSLFYVKQGIPLPFLNEPNITKAGVKNIADVTRSTFNNPSGSVELAIKFPKKDQKGKQESVQWKFDMANKGIAQKWVDMLNNHKDAQLKKNKLPGTTPKNKLQVNNTNNNTKNKQEFDPMQLLLTDSRILNKEQNPKPQPQPPVTKPQQNSQLKPTNVNNNTKPTQPPNQFILVNSVYSKNLNPSPDPKNNLQQSRLSYAYQATSRMMGMQQSRIKPQNQNNLSNDWNFKFVKNPTRDTVYQFEKAATSAFFNFYNESRNTGKSFIRSNVGEYNIRIADIGTRQCKQLKNQYRNYDYILECCKLQAILSVPLTCLIEYCGSVGLVKARLPNQAPKINNKREAEQLIGYLQQKTKVGNSILFSNSSNFYDLTKIYGSVGENSRIYVDDLDQYMPEFNLKPKQKQDIDSTFYIRPQLMQYFQNRVMPGGNIQTSKNSKAKTQYLAALESQIKDIAQCLNNQQIYITNIFDFKEFLHFRGVNMKFLHQIYQQAKNKFVKRYLHTCLVAKIIKDQINLQLTQLSKQSKRVSLEQCAQDQIRYFIQGQTATANEYWKRITLQYRRLYGSSLNTHELIGGFLLSCLITLLPGKYNLSSIDKQKVIFKDQGIIKKGFIKQLLPKIKSYYRFDLKIAETAEICKYSQKNEQIYKQLVGYMNLNSKDIPQSFNINKSRSYILGYLSDFIAPEGLGHQKFPCAREIYSWVNQQPPSVPSLKITENYLKQYINGVKTQRLKADEQFQSIIRQSVNIINFWLQVQHPRICQFYEKIAAYQEYCGNTEQSLQILEKAIQIACKTEAKNSKKIGTRHYTAGCQYLKSGKKKEAIDNLQKAKNSMQKSQGQQNEYALVLLKLSSLQLNSGDTQSCIKYGRQALKNAQKGKMSDIFSIKIYQILCRAFEIKNEKQQLRKLSIMCSKQFNRTQQRAAFSEMIKICLTGTMSRLSFQRSKSLLLLVKKLKQQNKLRDQNQSLAALMQRAKSGLIVMEIFMLKTDNAQRYFNQYISKKELTGEASEFLMILSYIAGCVGLDFIEGLHDQKEFQ